MNLIKLYFLSTGMLAALITGTEAAAVPIGIEGTFMEILGISNGKKYEIRNNTGEDMYDLTVSIGKEPGGGDPGAKIQRLGNNKGWKVDDDDDVLDTPALGGKIKTPNNAGRVKKGDVINLDLVLTGDTTSNYKVTIQPTDKQSRAIGDGIKPNFFDINDYQWNFVEEELQLDLFTGLAFNDVNATGDTLTELFLLGSSFQITSAVQKNAIGDDLLGSIFDPITGKLELIDPVADGDQFFIGVEVDNFSPGNMVVWASTTLDPMSRSPIPEPSTLILFLIGSVGLAGSTRERIRQGR